MENFDTINLRSKDIDGTVLTYAKTRPLSVEGENFFSNNNYLLIPNLINVSAHKTLCKRLNLFWNRT